MSWYFLLLLPCAACMYNGWKARFPRDKYRWMMLENLILGAFAVASFLDIVSSNPMPLALVSLMMLMIAFLAGAVAGVYCIRWLHTPPGPARLRVQVTGELVGVKCSLCEDVIDAPGGEYPMREMVHHLRLFHPDQYESLNEELRSQF